MNHYRIQHNKKIAKMFNTIFLVHIPLAPLLAFLYKTEMSIALTASITIALSSYLASQFMAPSSKSIVDLSAANAMFSSALVMYLMRGIPESHYHFFVMMSFLIAYAMPRAVIVATLIITVHHLSTYFLLPGSGFPVDYPIERYALHFVAAVAQALPCLVIIMQAAKIIDNQGTIINDLKENAMSSKSRSVTLVQQSEKMTNSISGQVKVIDEMVVTLDELSSIMKENIDSIEGSGKDVSRCHDMVAECKQKMNNMSHAMKDIDESNDLILNEVDAITSRFSDIETVMNNISSKTQIINDITFQTKLLAFNASVESARAGEHGKGFAVVAEEVGKLAQTSGTAAIEINDLISDSHEQVSGLLKDIQNLLERHLGSSKDKVRIAIDLSEDSMDSLETVMHSIDSLKSTFEKITVSSKEEGSGLTNIHEAIKLFQEHIKSTKDMVEVSNSLSNEMNNKSAEIIEFIVTLENNTKSESSDGVKRNAA